MRAVVMSLLLSLAMPAYAQHEVCTEPYSKIQLGSAIGKVEAAFDAGDMKEARIELQIIGDQLICLDEIVPKPLLAKFARLMATSFFFQQDEEQATKWAIMSKQADPELSWEGTPFKETHPFREIFEYAEEPVLGALEDRELLQNKKQTIYIDGNVQLNTETEVEMLHLVQIFDKDGVLVQGYWQEGTRFPDWMLVGEKGKKGPKPPKSGGGGGGDLPVVPIAVSGGLLATSGITYILANAAKSGMKNDTTTDELTASRSRANTMVLISTVALAGGVGVGVTGVLVSADGVGVQFRW